MMQVMLSHPAPSPLVSGARQASRSCKRKHEDRRMKGRREEGERNWYRRREEGGGEKERSK